MNAHGVLGQGRAGLCLLRGFIVNTYLDEFGIIRIVSPSSFSSHSRGSFGDACPIQKEVRMSQLRTPAI